MIALAHPPHPTILRHSGAPWVAYNAHATQQGSRVYTLASLEHDPACVHNGTWLADVRMGEPGDSFDHRVGSANVRLIASAPNLLAACQVTLAMLETWQGEREFSFEQLVTLHRVVASAVRRAAGDAAVHVSQDD